MRRPDGCGQAEAASGFGRGPITYSSLSPTEWGVVWRRLWEERMCEVVSSRDEVCDLLREAFGGVPCPYRESRLHRRYWRARRRYLASLSPERMHWELPRVLADLIYDPDRDGGEDLVSALYWPGAPDASRSLKESWEESFSLFTPLQARAICEWLKYLSTLSPERQFFDSQLRSAYAYWNRRAEG
ncbi:MAG: hypothetical protein ACYC2Y_05510 [Armatimonadota bacterium]